jgi:hypothetical protein
VWATLVLARVWVSRVLAVNGHGSHWIELADHEHPTVEVAAGNKARNDYYGYEESSMDKFLEMALCGPSPEKRKKEGEAEREIGHECRPS